MKPFCKIYLLKGNNLVIETKIPIPGFGLQDFSKSVTRWPQIHILHGSAFMENESNSKKILQQKSMVIIIQSVGGPPNNQLSIVWKIEKQALYV